jgi:hypothetical protein
VNPTKSIMPLRSASSIATSKDRAGTCAASCGARYGGQDGAAMSGLYVVLVASCIELSARAR